jgi:hypothetical protein
MPTVICNGECGEAYPRSAIRRQNERGIGVRFWLESVRGFVALVLAVLTVFVPDWIEVVLRINPDHGDGSLERMVVFGLAAISVGLAVAARHEWQRFRLAA